LPESAKMGSGQPLADNTPRIESASWPAASFSMSVEDVSRGRLGSQSIKRNRREGYILGPQRPLAHITQVKPRVDAIEQEVRRPGAPIE